MASPSSLLLCRFSFVALLLRSSSPSFVVSFVHLCLPTHPHRSPSLCVFSCSPAVHVHSHTTHAPRRALRAASPLRLVAIALSHCCSRSPVLPSRPRPLPCHSCAAESVARCTSIPNRRYRPVSPLPSLSRYLLPNRLRPLSYDPQPLRASRAAISLPPRLAVSTKPMRPLCRAAQALWPTPQDVYATENAA